MSDLTPKPALLPGSYRTTGAGIAGLVGSLCGLILVPYLDNDPATVPMWAEFLGLAVPLCIGLIAARDNAVSSEAAGAKPPTGPVS